MSALTEQTPGEPCECGSGLPVLPDENGIFFRCCADCADHSMASDRFKEEYGFRPRMERDAVLRWYRGGMVGWPS
jgi:hypothetical protein